MPLHIKPIPPLKLTPPIETLPVSDVIDYNPLNHSAQGWAHTIAEVISLGLLNPELKLWNDKRSKLQALTLDRINDEEAFMQLRTSAPAVKNDLHSYIEVTINFTPRTEDEFGGFTTRMEAIHSAIELIDLKSKDVWAIQMLLEQASWLEEKIGARFDRDHDIDYVKVKGLKGMWDEQKGFFCYVPYRDDTFMEVIFTRHRVFHDLKFKPPVDEE